MKRLISSLPGIGLGVMMALSAQAADRYDLKFSIQRPGRQPDFHY